MRLLVVADEYPWPARTGYRQRLAWVVQTLAAQGTVDLLAVVYDKRTAVEPPPGLPLGHRWVVPADLRAEPRADLLRRWLGSRSPRVLLRRDWSGPRTVLAAALADERYDAVWFSHAPAFLALGDLIQAPAVVDLDNLDSVVLRHRRRSRLRTRPQSVRGWLSVVARSLSDALDERRWRRLEGRIADEASAVVVCSELDRERLARDSVWVVPNGYEGEGAGRGALSPQDARPGTGPVLTMVGLLTYEPNRDAATFFATQVLPQIRRERPEAQFRVVGRYGGESDVAAVRGLPGVVVTGEVEDIGGELALADVAVVPIRFGGGTRIKILEAFAHRIPVVTTTIGCEGLDVVPGKHLLVADDAPSFASACLRLQLDEELRVGLTTAAATLWESRYRWSTITPAIVDVVQAVGGAGRR